jgi:hypothetical protein
MTNFQRWAPLPPATGRWRLPKAPRQAASNSLRIYQPVTVKGLIGWQVARGVAAIGAFRFLPGNEPPSKEVTELLSAHLIPYRFLAVAEANHPSRYLVLLMGASGECTAVAKMAFDESGRAALAREAVGIHAARGTLSGCVRPPHLQNAGDGLLLLDAVAWQPRLAPWRLPREVAHSLGVYSKTQGDPRSGTVGAHGDFAPWNLLQTQGAWVLLDWEYASPSKPPFFDLWHYLLQAHILLGRPSAKTLVGALKGESGWVRDAVVEYARGLGRSPEDAKNYFEAYIAASAERIGGDPRQIRHGLRLRSQLQHQIAAL